MQVVPIGKSKIAPLRSIFLFPFTICIRIFHRGHHGQSTPQRCVTPRTHRMRVTRTTDHRQFIALQVILLEELAEFLDELLAKRNRTDAERETCRTHVMLPRSSSSGFIIDFRVTIILDGSSVNRKLVLCWSVEYDHKFLIFFTLIKKNTRPRVDSTGRLAVFRRRFIPG